MHSYIRLLAKISRSDQQFNFLSKFQAKVWTEFGKIKEPINTQIEGLKVNFHNVS